MIKPIWTFLFLSIAINSMLGQEAYFDSVEANVIYMDEDSTKLDALADLVKEYQNKDAKKTLDYAQQMLELAFLYEDKDRNIKAKYAIGLSFYKLYEVEQALPYFKQSINTVLNTDSAKYADILRDAYFNIGNIHTSQLHPDKARVFYQKALVIASKQGSRWNIPKIEFEIANTFFEEKDYIRAVVFFKKAEKSYNKIKFRTGAVKSLVGIAEAHLADQDDNQALYHFKKALETAKKSKKDKDIGFAKEKLGSFYFQKEFFRECYDWQSEALLHYQDAKDTINYGMLLSSASMTLYELDSMESGLATELEALMLFRKIDYQKGIARSLNHLGRYYTYQLKENDALSYLEEAVDISEDINDQNALMENLITIGSFHVNKRRYQQALSPTKRAFSIAEKLDDKIHIVEASDILAKIYNKLRDFENAFFYQELSENTRKALDSQLIDQLTDKAKTNRNKYQNEVKKSQSNSVWKFVALALIIVLGLLGFFLWKLLKADKERQQQLEELTELLKDRKEQS